MKLRLYLDEDSLDQSLIRGLRARGLDVSSALTAGMRRRSDADQLTHASSEGRVLFTYNVGDFCRLHSQRMSTGGSHAGLIVAQQRRYSVGEQMRRLLRIAATLSAEDMVNRLEFLSSW